MNNSLQASIAILIMTSITVGQTAFMQLTPGLSTRADADRVLGAPVTKTSEVLAEHRHAGTGQKMYVQYRQQANIIDRIEVFFEPPMPRSGLAGMLGLAGQPEAVKYDKSGRMEEYFGGDRMIVLTHESSDSASPITRVGYFSKDLFALALQQPTGQPVKPAASSAPGTLAAAGAGPSGSGQRAAVKMFKNVDLMVPKGDKSESKSVRLLFDGQYMVIDADGGEKIYKEFPYAGIVSGEYSYSSSPRWKTAIGAAVLIGVFAIPLFFMKGKKHWLTVKTANDFAIMRLDKDNYKVILATFETTVGKKVEMVGDDK